MIDLAVFLKRNGYRPDQVQDFIPSPVRHRGLHVLHGHRPVHEEAGVHRPASARPQAAAGPDAVLQAGELFRGPPGAGAGRPARPDRQRLRLPDSRAAAERGWINKTPAAYQFRSKPAGGYRPQRKTAAKRERARPGKRIGASQMSIGDQYQLLDFGAGRKLERFGPYVLDRPAPAAHDAVPRDGALWSQADARYERGKGERGRWSFTRAIDHSWHVHHGPLALEVKLTEFGHLGIFPEQAENWTWIARQVRAAGRPMKVLNLFAYTGGGTLAAAAAGAEVTHVDAAAGVVTWARRNAHASRLNDAPIRWITEDALKFARRELKRGQRYDAVILDPPGYGHGPRGETWKLDERLGELLAACLELTADRRRFILLSCHSGDWAFAPRLLK